MKMLITGTSGFIGSRLLASARQSCGQEVVAFSSRACSGPHIVYNDSEARFGLDQSALRQIEETEVLIHAGAYTPKSGNDANQRDGCYRNITFIEQMLSLPWRRLQRVIYLSTIDVYASMAGLISEVTPAMPGTLYGLSKLYGERTVSLFTEELGISCQVLRIGHVYGPGEEKYAKVLPTAIKNILTGKDVELWGDGNEMRSFIYIADVVKAILRAVDLKENPGVINLVSGNKISIRALLETLITLGGGSTRLIQRQNSGPSRDVIFDAAKLKQYLLPTETDFNEGLQSEFTYFREILTGKR